MIEDDVHREPEGVDPELIDLADDYLDDLLNEDEARAFESRLLDDREARDALIQSLTLRGLVDLALAEDGIQPASGRCGECRAFMPAYKNGKLDPTHVGLLSQHLDECPACAAFYQAFADGSGSETRVNASKAFPIAGLILLGAALFAPVFWWLGSRAGSEPGTSVGPATAAAAPTWPDLPLAPDALGELVDLVRGAASHNDIDPLVAAADMVTRRDPGFLERTGREPAVADVLYLTRSSDLADATRHQAVLLLVVLHDSRLSAGDRSVALAPLCGTLVHPRPFLWRVAESAQSVAMLKESLARLFHGTWDTAERPLVRALEEKIHGTGDREVLESWLLCLGEAGDPETRRQCKEVLLGRFGAFPAGPFPNAAAPLLAAAKRTQAVDSAVRDLVQVASESPLPAARLNALSALWSQTQERAWHEAILALARDPEARVRKGVASHLISTATEADRQLLESLASDPEPPVAETARQAIQRLALR